MPANYRAGRGRRGSVFMLYTLSIGLVVLPLLGLGIDMGVLYMVQARLWAGVDGAALGVGRMLGKGMTDDRLEEVGAEFLQSTFPAGYWSVPQLASAPQSDCNQTASALPANSFSVRHCTEGIGSHRVKVNAKIEVPLIFLRILNVDHATISTGAEATRRDSRVVLVVDRSFSMSPVWSSQLKPAAIAFTGMFRRGIDRLGLVVYGTTGVVAYPNYSKPYSTNVHDGTGPNVNFIDERDVRKDGTETYSYDMLRMLYLTQNGYDTATAEALWLAYIELQKGHFTDLASEGSDNRLNAIVLFTDGFPTRISAYINNPTAGQNSLRARNAVMPCTTTNPPQPPRGTSSTDPRWNPNCSCCLNNPADPNAASTQMIASIGLRGYATGDVTGPNQVASLDNTSTVTWVQRSSGAEAQDPGNLSTAWTTNSGCRTFTSNPGSPWTLNYYDIAKIPEFDIWNNSTRGTGFQNSDIRNTDGSPSADVNYVIDNGTPYDPTKAYEGNGRMWAYAAWNAADNAAMRIRQDVDGAGIRPRIYTIGYYGNSGLDQALLKRIANTPDSPDGGALGRTNLGTPGAYARNHSNEESGKFVAVYLGESIYGAFVSVASDILRLSQ
jgi:hypothetical protein